MHANRLVQFHLGRRSLPHHLITITLIQILASGAIIGGAC